MSESFLQSEDEFGVDNGDSKGQSLESSSALLKIENVDLWLEDEDCYTIMLLDALQGCKDMRSTTQLCDAILKASEGPGIPVHKSIMSTCSPYFRALFTDCLGRGKQQIEIRIPDISHEMLWLIVHYAYTHEALITEQNVTSLLPIADKFCVIDLLTDCIFFILAKINAKNCISIWKYAQTYFCKDLEEKAFNYILVNFKDVASESDEVLDLDIGEVVEIFGSEDLNVNQEKLVWNAILKWVDKDPENRKRHIVRLLGCVRLGLLESSFFMEEIKTHPYVAKNDQCRPLVVDTMRFIYDLRDITNRKDEVVTPSLALPRFPHEIMFAIGGWSGGSPTNVIEAYDTRADRWIMVPYTDPAGPRAYHQCVVVGLDIYIIGGFNGSEYYSSCRCFSPHTKTWKEIAPMNQRRCYVSAAVESEIIYAMGGYDGHMRQNTAEKFNYRTNQWSLIPPMTAQRSDACAATLNGLIYITGGFNGSECLNTCEYFDPATNEWRQISSMKSRRSGVACVAHNGLLFVLGGFNGISRLQSGEKYNPITDQWTAIPTMFNPRSNFAMDVIDELIFAVGGFNGTTTIYQVECFCTINNEWLEATDMNTFRSALNACVVKGLPNVREYVHQNRDKLMEEKRQKLIQAQEYEQRQIEQRARLRQNDDIPEEGDEDDDDDDDDRDDDDVIIE